MCSTTKHKIAATLRQMMMERSFQKITVQNLMFATGMKRQSFYYHFQDTRDVLCWICRKELVEPACADEEEFSLWVFHFLERLDADRGFYRRLFASGGQELLDELGERALRPRVAALLYPEQEQRTLDAHQEFSVNFVVRAMVCFFAEFTASRAPLDREEARGNIRCLLERIRPEGE